MKKTLITVLLTSSIAWGQSKLQPLNVKTGLWESSVTTTSAGHMPLPADLLAKLSPEQRAKFEARMNADSAPKTRTSTHKDCETKEKLAKQSFFDQKECQQTVVTSTSTRASVRMSCQFGDVKSSGTMNIEVLSPEIVKGSGQMTSTGGGRTFNMNTSFSAKWLGAACGNVK